MQTPGDSEGQGSLASCSPQGQRDGHNLATDQQKDRCKLWEGWEGKAWIEDFGNKDSFASI